MKAIKFTSWLVVTLAIAVAATGCQKRPVGVTQIPGTGTRVGDAGMAEGGTYRPDSEATWGGGSQPPIDPDNFDHDRAALAASTVYFDYDSSVVKSSEKSKVGAVAAYLGSTPGIFLLVEGHCDERGTEEYNRSLGERRALALREAIVLEGADGQRIITRSFGEDRPAAFGSNETTWAQNRRGEFVVLRSR